MCLKLTVYKVFCNVVRLQRLCHPSIWIGLADWAKQIIFLHQSADLLGIHDNPFVEQSHMNTSNALFISAIPVRLQDKFKILSVGIFLLLSVFCIFLPLVVTGS